MIFVQYLMFLNVAEKKIIAEILNFVSNSTQILIRGNITIFFQYLWDLLEKSA